MTPKERREKMIKDRANRLAKDAAKQGITPAELMKKKKDTYVNVVGGAALGALPVGAVLRGAGALFKGLSGGSKAAQAGKALNTASKTAKKITPKAKPAAKKPAAKKPAAKKQTAAKKPAAKPTSKAAQKTAAAKSKMTRAEAAGRAVGAARTNPRMKRAILGGAVTSATLATIDDVRKAGKGKAKADSGQTFSQAFAAARKKGVGTPFTYKGKKYTAVRDTDIPKSITGTKTERLRKFMNQRKQNKNLQKGKGK